MHVPFIPEATWLALLSCLTAAIVLAYVGDPRPMTELGLWIALFRRGSAESRPPRRETLRLFVHFEMQPPQSLQSADSALPPLPIPEPSSPAPGPPKPKRKYTFTERARASAMENLKKARAAPKELRHRSTPRRLAACRANLARALQSNCAADSPAYGACFSHGVTAGSLYRSARLCGESRAEFDRHVAAFARALPPRTERQRHAVRGLAEITWRHARVWGGRAHSERLQFYYWLGQAASPDLAPCGLDFAERLEWLEPRVTKVFRLESYDRLALEEQSEKIRHQAKRIARACVEELTGRPDREFYTVFKAQRGIAKLLDRLGEIIGNPFRSARAVRRALQVGIRDSGFGTREGSILGTNPDAANPEPPIPNPDAANPETPIPNLDAANPETPIPNPDAANPETRNPNPGSERRTEDEMVQFGLARLMAVHGGPLPDPLKPEDFACHLRIVGLALGIPGEDGTRGSGFGVREGRILSTNPEDGNSNLGPTAVNPETQNPDPGPTAKDSSFPNPESRTPNPEILDLVHEFATATWVRLGVFAAAAERERQQVRDACERAARGERFTPPRPQPPGEFDRERDDVDDWLDAAGAYLADPLPEEHHQVEAMLGAALAGNDDDDGELMDEAGVANVVVEQAFARLRGHGLKIDDSKEPGQADGESSIVNLQSSIPGH
ncbi:MAG TPA: hypothetical protein VGW33_06705 [Terriglobia bacterium]|nr:hypothetical protein [Terriglobia bacterium]